MAAVFEQRSRLAFTQVQNICVKKKKNCPHNHKSVYFYLCQLTQFS